MTEAFELSLNTDRPPLCGLIDLPEQSGQRPTVVICHGFKGFMEWGFFPFLAELLSERGFVVVRFNFSGSGMRPGDDLVTDIEAFRTATFSGDREDVLGVLAAAREGLSDRIDPARIGLFGHSRGGGAALLAAAHEASQGRIHALVTWAAVGTFDRLPAEAKDVWRQTGSMPIVNGRTGQELGLGVEVLDDLEAHREDLDIEKAARARRAPWLLIHGVGDETVPVSEARRLQEVAGPGLDTLLLPEAGHTLGARHPFQGPTQPLIEAMNATQTWFRRHLC